MKNRSGLIVGLVVLVALVAGVFILTQNGASDETTSTTTQAQDERAAPSLPPQGLIVPQTYQESFVDADQQHVLIDVRTRGEYDSGYIPGAINISLQDLQAGRGLDRIPDDQPVVLYCNSGNRSNQAYRLLSGQGYDNLYDLGGIQSWVAAGLPIEQ